MAGYIGSGASVVSSGAENKKVFDITTNTTSLTGLNYTVGKVHVYHNGVRLVDGTDYTATNSTSITLTVAAVSGDQVVVVSYASFQLSEHYTKAETDALVPSSIDDNGNATALTIDSSENVLVGRTSSSGFTTSSGSALFPNGSVFTTVDGGQALNVSRLNSDGNLVGFYKDGSAVGSIGSVSGTLYIGSPNGSDAFAKFNNNSITPSTSAGAARDNAIDLGAGSARFKDLYLSGDLYVNGQVKLANLASDPSDATTGGMYFNTTSGAVKVYDGSAWDQIQALTPFSTVNTRYQPHTQVNTQGAGAVKITSYGAAAWSAYDGGSGGGTYFGGHDGHNGNPTDYPAYVAVYLGGRHAVNRLNLALHGNHYGYFELQGSNNSGTGGSYDAGSWTSLPFITSNVSTQAQHAGGQYSGYSDGTVLTYQYNNDIAYSSYRLWIKDASQAGESLGTRYTGWATYYWELYRD